MEEPVKMRFKIRLDRIERNLEELKVAKRAIERAIDSAHEQEYELVEQTVQAGIQDIPALRDELRIWKKANPGMLYSRHAVP